jgi:hypothetical protein
MITGLVFLEATGASMTRCQRHVRQLRFAVLLVALVTGRLPSVRAQSGSALKGRVADLLGRRCALDRRFEFAHDVACGPVESWSPHVRPDHEHTFPTGEGGSSRQPQLAVKFGF